MSYVGEEIDDDLLSFITPVTVIKAVTEARNNTTVSSNDAELTGIPLVVGKYLVRTVLLTAWSTSGTSTVGFKNRWAFTGTATGVRACLGIAAGSTGTTAASMRSIGSALTTENGYGVTDTFAHPVREEAIVTVTVAGNLSVQWAQAVSAASQISVLANSFLEYRRLE